MKKPITKLLALVLCAVLLGSILSGCGLLDQIGKFLPELPFGNKTESPTSTEFTLSQATDFYAEPNWDSTLLATYYEGYTVTYTTVVTLDGCTWAQAEEGWFVLDGSRPLDVINIYDVEMEGYACRHLYTFDAPASTADAYSQVAVGSALYIFQVAETFDGVWANTEFGWVSMDGLYIPGEPGPNAGYGVTRTDVTCLSRPGVQSNVTDQLASGMRFEVYAQIEIDGYWWGHTEYGWVAMDDVYVEGTEGLRPCYVMVIDSTPLNVRLGPGTDYEKLSKLHYGDYVQILERVERNGSDWGYTGEGWIFMDLTEIQ